MRVLVTRPRGQAEATAELLRQRGYEPLVDSVLTIESVPLPPIDPAGLAALAVTSANAVPSLPAPLRGLPVFCVGQRTAAALRRAGWDVTAVACGDGASLARTIAAELPPGRVLHPGGEDRAPGLSDGLVQAGFMLDHAVTYRAVPVTSLPEATRRALEADRLDVVLLMSPRTARVWCGLVTLAGLARRATHLLAGCLSPAVADAAACLPWREVRIAMSRDHQALVDSLADPR